MIEFFLIVFITYLLSTTFICEIILDFICLILLSPFAFVYWLYKKIKGENIND